MPGALPRTILMRAFSAPDQEASEGPGRLALAMLTSGGDGGLKGTQEIKDILLLTLRELVKEFSYNSIRFGPRTPVLLYGAFQIFCSAIVKKKGALAEPP